MKKIYLIISMTLLSLGAWAQGYTTHSFGYLGGQSNAGNSQDSIQVTFSGGSVIAPGQFQTILQDRVQVLTGFPAMVSYFPRVFDNQLFISKGYFSDYVQLQWNIVGQQDRIERIKVFRKPLGSAGDSTLVASLAADNFTYRDEYAEKGQLYSYTIFAEGIADELRIPEINIMEGVGFAFPFGTASGRVTYDGGTAVEGVQILAETDGNLGGKAIELNGTDAYLLVEHLTDHDELLLEAGFSVQLWNQYTGTGKGVLFSKGSQYELSYEADNLSFRVGSETLNLAYTPPADAYFHVTAIYDPALGLTLYVQENDNHLETASLSASISLVADIEPIYFGRDESGTDFYHGYLDEIRVWNTPLTEEEAKGNFSRYLSGSEEGLAGYWKLNSGIGQGFYDFSRVGFDFNENHGELKRATWTEEIPGKSQLAYRGVTDAQGNFVVRGFPYETSGSQYTFTPLFDVHEFEPTQQLRFVGDGSSIFNGLDFEDVSSFPVSGFITYSNTPFPVEDIRFLIDGNLATSGDGSPILSDTNGEFILDVPIGFHSLQVVAANHVFENNGQFPLPNAEEETPLYDFQAPLPDLEFYDSTLVRVSGRVVGGPIESAKPLGFGISKSNIGNATISMRPKKLKNLTFVEVDSVLNVTEDHFSSATTFNVRDITIEPDVESGEFVAYLPPEEYIVSSVTTTNYIFDESHNIGVNLINALFEEETILRQDTLSIKVGEEEIFVNPMDIALFDTVFTVSRVDSLFTIAVDTFRVDHKQDFILRVVPQITVTDLSGSGYFGDQAFTYVDDNLGIENEFDLIDAAASNPYKLGHPVFTQRGNYRFKVELFEQYVDELGVTSEVPVVDGEVRVLNDLAINKNEVTLPLNTQGSATYSFSAGLPNIAVDDTDASKSFTKTISVTGYSGNDGAIQTIWKESDPFTGIVLGGIPTGNNFVTAGPNEIITILRDPPGSQSTAFIEEGTTFSKASSLTSSSGLSTSANLEVKVGFSATTLNLLSGTIDSNTALASVEAGISSELNYESSNTRVETTEFTRTISTSDELVGADGDVFVGYSTNLVYGLSRNLTFLTDAECTGPECMDSGIPGYKIGLENGLWLNPEFATFFILSQFTIEQITIPNLKQIRDQFLIYSTQPDTINPISTPVYISKVAPDDERFGSNNFDQDVWSDQAIESLGDGPSYTIKAPQALIDAGETIGDTLVYYNQQISDWQYWLAHNERVKLESQTKRNVTFDGNVTLEESETTSIQEESTRSVTVVLDASIGVGAEVDTEVFGVAFQMNASASFGYDSSTGSSETASGSNSTTYGFTLDDGDLGDTYTVDIKDAIDGFGPVFSTRGGATSCPYEDESVTKYFEPGTVLSAATAQREIPSLSVDASAVEGVPENRAAIFNLQLKNNSETGEDFEMKLDLVDGTNPFGAIIAIDGATLGNGLVFNVPAGQVLNKTMTLRQGRPDITDYENIKLQLRSLCQSDPNDNLADITDVVEISAYFVPGCSDVALTLPNDLWVLNSRAPVEDNLSVAISEYDLNFGNFERIDFQYRPANSSQWITDIRFYNPQNVTQADFDDLDEPKQFIAGSVVNYNFDMSALPDREYQIRAITRCVLGPGSEVTTPSEILTGIKDTKRPGLFGAPQPADGVLSANDEIMIQFDETIEAGLLSLADISVRGVLNSAEIKHNTSINLDGTNDYIKIQDGLNLSDKSFTIEFWINRENFSKEQVVYSKGYTANDIFEIGFNAANNLYVNVGGEQITSIPSYTALGWNHFAIAYDIASDEVSGYMNDQFIFDGVPVTGSFTGEGSIVLGKSQITDDRHSDANIHEFRIWTKFRQFGDVFAKMSQTLTGSEVGLVGYWPMEEALGNKAFDLARSRHATLFADWEVSTQGKSYAFDGVDDYLQLSTGSTVVVTDEMDYSIEFWFNGAPDQTDAVIFSNGKGDGSDVYNDPENSISIGFDSSGSLYFLNNGEKLTVSSGDYLDDNWHHFAFTLLRQSNANVFVDGVQKATVSSANFGGLSSASMWLGTRSFQENEVDLLFDQHFNGSVDEFRIWNLGKKSDQVNLNINSRLQGDEIGLVAYYPFETYEIQAGVQILSQTIADQWINPFGDNAGNATSFGGADFTDDTPNIKDARPVTKIDFDWAVNDDKIVITPSNNFTTLIEQTVLEITIQNVEDLYENRLASPASWTAFVDRNQVKWDTDRITAKKEVYEPYTFTVDVANLGGTETSYAIENLPVWLSASPSSGVLSPVSSQTITLTVDEGLNTGYYLEDVFLSSDFGFDEKLTVDLQVFSPEPEWNTNPFDFQFSMNLVAQLEIKDILSSDVNDRVAAFVNDTLRGDANIAYIEELDLYEVFLDIYSNVESGETIELRVWDASKGTEYRNALPSIAFSSNTIIGTPSSPDKIIAGTTSVQKISFESGWNWTSMNVTSGNLSDINALMSNVESSTGDQIKGIDKFDIYTDGFGWSGTLSSAGGLKNGLMYLFNLSNSGSIEVIGTQVEPSTAIDITTGWNWLGFLPRFNQSVNEAFAFFNPTSGDIIKSQFAFAVYDENLGWIGSLKNLEPGKGYLFNSTTAGAFTFPESSSLGGRVDSENIVSNFEQLNRHKYANTMTVIAELEDGAGTDFGLAAYHNDELMGLIEPLILEDGSALYFMTVYGDTEVDEVHFKAIDMTTGIAHKLDQTMTFAKNQPLGNLSAPFQLTGLSKVTGIASVLDDILIYPNPFKESLTVLIPALGAPTKLEFTDISGRIIKTMEFPSGQAEKVRIDGSRLHLSPGIYLLRVQSGDEVKSYSIIKEK